MACLRLVSASRNLTHFLKSNTKIIMSFSVIWLQLYWLADNLSRPPPAVLFLDKLYPDCYELQQKSVATLLLGGNFPRPTLFDLIVF